ncbi:MAG: tetratricopeptide (TPR) repeat protein [Cognaticolwellia sp.]|jgi:tetratricopeptide (TPR) repeat protein
MSQWATRQVKGQLRDVQLDARGRPAKLLPWKGPMQRLRDDACGACGDWPRQTPCADCGAHPSEVDKLTDRLAARMGGDLLTAAETAGERGCHVLAVRFATAAWHRGTDRDVAMTLRLQELEAAGLGALAAEEALHWATSLRAPAYAAGIAGELMARNGRESEALVLIDQALERTPEDDSLRLDRARLILGQGQIRDAGMEAAALCVPSRELAEEALQLVLEAAEELLKVKRSDEALLVLDATAPHGHRNPNVCEAIAKAETQRGRFPSARRWLVHTLSLDPLRQTARERLGELEDQMGIARSIH